MNFEVNYECWRCRDLKIVKLWKQIVHELALPKIEKRVKKNDVVAEFSIFGV